MKKALLPFILLSTCMLPPPSYSQEGEANYPTLFLLQWAYQCAEQMQPQFQAQGMPRQLALQFGVQQCSCVIDEFRKNYRYEQTITMDFSTRAEVATKLAERCMVGVNTDQQI